LRDHARSFVRDVLSPDTLRKRNLFDEVFVQRLIDEHETGFAEHGSLLWALISVELWHRIFLDTQQRSERRDTAYAVHA